MAKYEVPGVGVFDFPDDATPDEINEFAQNAISASEQLKKSEAPTAGDYAARQAGLMTRAIGTSPALMGAGIGAALAAPTGVGVPVGAAAGAAAGTILDVVPRVYNAISQMAGSERRLPPIGDVLKQVAEDVGLPRPATRTEMIAEKAIETGGAALTPIGAGRLMAQATSPVIRGVGQALSSQPQLQTLLSGAGGAAAEMARQEGAGEIGQTAAALAPILIPAAAGVGAIGIRKAAAMGATPQEVAANIAPFSEMGVPVSYGQALQKELPQYVERAVEKFPLAPSTYQKFAERQRATLGGKVEQIRRELSQVTEPTEAGRAIQEGVSAPAGQIKLPSGGKIEGTIGGLTERAKLTNQRLYGKLENLIPPQKPVGAVRTIEVLDEILKPIQGVGELAETAMFAKPRIADFRDRFARQIMDGKGKTNFEVLKSLRSSFGQELENVKWGDVPPDIREIKQIYGALSEDMRRAAEEQGQAALRAFDRANKYNRAYHQRIDRIQSVINKKNPEQAYVDAFSEQKIGGTKIRAILQSIPKEDQKEVVSSFIARMGKAPASQQDEYGQIFDIGKFANNYRALNPAARQALFSRFGSQFKRDMDTIASVAIEISRARGILANPSGTAASVAPVATATAAGGALAAGKLSFASGILGTVAIGSGLSRLFTNQKFVNWLAKNIEIPSENYAAAIAGLETIAKEDDDIEMMDIARKLREQDIRNNLGR